MLELHGRIANCQGQREEGPHRGIYSTRIFALPVFRTNSLRDRRTGLALTQLVRELPPLGQGAPHEHTSSYSVLHPEPSVRRRALEGHEEPE